mmetsp:Transcript_27840/g.64481  ORF Transcript_27840/g.64481 Transcript_27840/m.64481 type:complete len:136 (+) Transcript_27840:713-1120(+)
MIPVEKMLTGCVEIIFGSLRNRRRNSRHNFITATGIPFLLAIRIQTDMVMRWLVNKTEEIASTTGTDHHHRHPAGGRTRDRTLLRTFYVAATTTSTVMKKGTRAVISNNDLHGTHDTCHGAHDTAGRCHIRSSVG